MALQRGHGKANLDVLPGVFEMFSCPACGEGVPRSNYLLTVFRGDPYAEWMANLVTHWRHDHQNGYNASLQSTRYRDKMWRGRAYEEVKAEINNRAKRQLMRAIARSRWPRKDKYGLVDAVGRLQNGDSMTLELRMKLSERLGGGPGGETEGGGTQLHAMASTAAPSTCLGLSAPESAGPRRPRQFLEDWAEG